MHLTYKNVNHAFTNLVSMIHRKELPTTVVTSRYGEVAMVEEPMTITYENPMQCVLFNQARDCNPFFHMYEALYMLAGRNDVEPLAYYNSKMREFSDNGKTFNGAYGYRWRMATDWNSIRDMACSPVEDQLPILINHLKENPNSRRAVLQMWTVEDDLLKIGGSPNPAYKADGSAKYVDKHGCPTFPPDSHGREGAYSKDICCNTCVYFLIRHDPTLQPVDDRGVKERGISYLDMTVCNRSNDMIWGMLGANVVHFAFLQEYMACALGIEVGVYNQFTNNLHVYAGKWEPEKWLEGTDPNTRHMRSSKLVEYKDEWKSFRLFDGDHTRFEYMLKGFVDSNLSVDRDSISDTSYPFLDKVAQPMMNAFHAHKQRDYESAYKWMVKVEADDWRTTGIEWIKKRRLIWEKKCQQIVDK